MARILVAVLQGRVHSSIAGIVDTLPIKAIKGFSTKDGKPRYQVVRSRDANTSVEAWVEAGDLDAAVILEYHGRKVRKHGMFVMAHVEKAVHVAGYSASRIGAWSGTCGSTVGGHERQPRACACVEHLCSRWRCEPATYMIPQMQTVCHATQRRARTR